MADSFQGTDYITIQPKTSDVPYHFKVTVATASTLNDGQLPFNSSMISFAVSAHRQDGSTSYGSSDIVSASSLTGNTMMVRLSYSTALTCPALYHLRFQICATVDGTMDNPLYKELDFNRVQVRDY